MESDRNALQAPTGRSPFWEAILVTPGQAFGKGSGLARHPAGSIHDVTLKLIMWHMEKHNLPQLAQSSWRAADSAIYLAFPNDTACRLIRKWTKPGLVYPLGCLKSPTKANSHLSI
jgi:hypothetical protein